MQLIEYQHFNSEVIPTPPHLALHRQPVGQAHAPAQPSKKLVNPLLPKGVLTLPFKTSPVCKNIGSKFQTTTPKITGVLAHCKIKAKLRKVV
jgi:hypothetical protein